MEMTCYSQDGSSNESVQPHSTTVTRSVAGSMSASMCLLDVLLTLHLFAGCYSSATASITPIPTVMSTLVSPP